MTTTATLNVRGEIITPEVASAYLALNTHNRAEKKGQLAKYVHDMVNGDWVWNGESIKFGDNGALLDGQHRLEAIIKAGVAIQMLVIRDLPVATQETMDGGARRSFADALKLRGETQVTLLAAVANIVSMWRSGDRNFSGYAGHKATNADLSRTLERFPELREATRKGGLIQKTAGLTGAVAGLSWWLFSRIDASDAEFFFERLVSDQGHQLGNPIYTLRRTLVSDKAKGRGRRETLALVIKAWNKYRAGSECSILTFRSGGAKPEAFPEPV